MAGKYDRSFILRVYVSAGLFHPDLPGAYCVVILPVRRERRQQIPRVVCDPILRHHIPPVGHICIVSEGEYTRGRDLGREEGLRPWFGRVLGCPRLVAIAGQAVYEDDAGREIINRGVC